MRTYEYTDKPKDKPYKVVYSGDIEILTIISEGGVKIKDEFYNDVVFLTWDAWDKIRNFVEKRRKEVEW